jgi:AcrR family transcriptional regulator
MTSDSKNNPLNPEEREAASVRRRGSQLEDAVLDAAWDVLINQGYQGFTFEAVAARAGTSRPVLYRRWPSRNDLLLATIAKFWRSNQIAVPDTGNLRDDAIGLLRNAEIGGARMLTLVSARMTDFFRDTGSSFNELRKTLHRPGEPSGCEAIIARAVARGELPDVPRSSRAVNLLLDLFRHEVFMTTRLVPDETIIEIVDHVWLPLMRSEISKPGRTSSSNS